MEIECYALFERLGLIRDIVYDKNGYRTCTVSAKADDVYAVMCLVIWLILTVGLFVIGLLICRLMVKKGRANTAMTALRCGICVLLAVGILHTVGIGPYIEFYPGQNSSSFIDLSVIDHFISGIGYAISALCLFFGGKTGIRSAARKYFPGRYDQNENTVMYSNQLPPRYETGNGDSASGGM